MPCLLFLPSSPFVYACLAFCFAACLVLEADKATVQGVSVGMAREEMSDGRRILPGRYGRILPEGK